MIDAVAFEMTANIVNTAVNNKTSTVESTRKKQKKRVKSKCQLHRQRKIMTNGLSSILDLADNSLGYQRSLFNQAQWSKLELLFESRLRIDPVELSEKVQHELIIVSGTSGLSGDRQCRISLTVLKVTKKHLHVLMKTSSKNVIESDYLRCIWSRIPEAVFPPEKNLIRIKSGESINSASNVNKNK